MPKPHPASWESGAGFQPAIPRRNKCIALVVALPQTSMPRGSRESYSDVIARVARGRTGLSARLFLC